MGKKLEEQQRYQQQQEEDEIEGDENRGLLCCSCSAGLYMIGQQFNLKCLFVLIFSISVILPVIFWVFPHRSPRDGFDAKESIKVQATVQAYFELEKPVSSLVPHIDRLQYDIYEEISVPFTKVAILSMHQVGTSNHTGVVFGFLPDSGNDKISPAIVSLVRAVLLDLFTQQYNLTLTASIFGQPSSFGTVKCPEGVTLMPEESSYIWQTPQVLFNFTLPNSMEEIIENFSELKDQLKVGLHLRYYENVYVQLTNTEGSTRDPPVIVQASVMSDTGNLLPQRLKQLAQTITGSPPAKNLGLDNSVFGKVKEIRLSSILDRTLHASPPAPSPSPTPEPYDKGEPPSPSLSPAIPPVSYHHSPPCLNCDAAAPADNSYPPSPSPRIAALPPISSSIPPVADARPMRPSPLCGSSIAPSPSPSYKSVPLAPAFAPRVGPLPGLSPGPTPLPSVSYGSSPRRDGGNENQSSPPDSLPAVSPHSSSTASTYPHMEFWMLSVCIILSLNHLSCWF